VKRLLLATFQKWVKNTTTPPSHNSLEPITKTTWKTEAGATACRLVQFILKGDL
jgi:hypothetical protein